MKSSFLAAALAVGLAGPAVAQDPVWDGNKVVLESQKLAEGVFAIIPTGADVMADQGHPIATTGGFVIGDSGVLVVESMLNERLNKQLFALIAEQTDKPVRYLVNTSYHGDHSYGNHFLPEDVMIIQHADAAAYIADHFEADTQFMIQNFGAGRGIEEVEATPADILVPDGASIDVNLGDRTVTIRDFGFAQTGGDLFVSVPDANVLWTGNAVIAKKPAIPWLLDKHLIETLETLKNVHASFDQDTKVVPGHGPVTTLDAVKWNIDYLSAVRDNVQAAIDDGLDIEQTVSRVKLPEFAGYALFDWVHPGLNVPAAYEDLMKFN
jgi:glyoxylase-like metal-dependent hydrolase (beta-lactamase superfamily II)